MKVIRIRGKYQMSVFLSHRTLGIAIIGMGCLLTTQPAQAQGSLELITNGGFDATAYTTNNVNYILGNAPMAGMTPITGVALATVGPVISGWATTANNSAGVPTVEVWNGTFNSPSQGPRAYNGAQYAEMNSSAAGTLLQQITNVAPGSPLYLSFAHSDRGGDTLASTMRVTLWDLGANGAFNSNLATPGSSNAVAGGDDSILIDQLITATAFASGATPITNNWTFHEFQAPATTSNNMVLTFQSVTTGTTGNFIDSVSLNTTSQVSGGSVSAPEPCTLMLITVGGVFMARSRRKKQN
jgi:hypothetical protein